MILILVFKITKSRDLAHLCLYHTMTPNFVNENRLNAMIEMNLCLKIIKKFNQSINQFSGPAYPWGVAGAAAQVGTSKHLDPLQQRIDALLGCQGETN